MEKFGSVDFGLVWLRLDLVKFGLVKVNPQTSKQCTAVESISHF